MGELRSGAAALVAEKNQVGAAAHAKFREQVRNVEFNGAFGNVQAIGNFFIGEIFEQAVQNFLLAAAEFGGRIAAQAAALRAAENRIDEPRKNRRAAPKSRRRRPAAMRAAAVRALPRNSSMPFTPWRSRAWLSSSFRLSPTTNRRASALSIEDIAEQGARGLSRGMRIDHVDGSLAELRDCASRAPAWNQAACAYDLEVRILEQTGEIRRAPSGCGERRQTFRSDFAGAL